LGYFFFLSLFVSGLYIFNDLLDLKEDQGREDKLLGSGRFSPGNAVVLCAILLTLSGLFFVFVGWTVLPVLGAYLIVFLLYNFLFKRWKYLDFLWVPMGYPLRALMGAYAIEVAPSPWLFLLTYLGGVYLLAGKRVYEHELGKGTVNRLYSCAELKEIFRLFLPVTVSSYAVFAAFHGEWFWLTILPVLYLSFRYKEHVEGGKTVDSFFLSPPFIIFSWIWVVLVMFLAR